MSVHHAGHPARNADRRPASTASRLALALGLCSGGALAAADPAPLSATVVLDGGYIAEERPRDGGGSFTSDWQLAEARLFLRPHRAVRLGIGLGASRVAYHDTGLDHDLPETVWHAWLRVPVAAMFHQHWGISVQGSFGTGHGEDANASDGRQWQVQSGPFYRRDEDLIVALLVNVSSRIDDSPSVFVLPSLYWRFHPDWRLTVVDDVDNLSTLRYAVHDGLDLGLRVDVRLRDAAVTSDQALSDDHAAVALQATWMPYGRDGVEITPLAGALLARRLAERDGSGDEQWSLITRPAPLVGLDLRATF